MTRCEPQPPFADLVFGIGTPERRRHGFIALLVTIAVHAALWFGVRRVEPTHRAAPVEEPMRIEVELEPPEPPPRPAAPEPPSAPLVARAPRRRVETPRPAAPAPAPAQAAAVIAREPAPDSPLDFTQDVFVVGGAQTYAGGVSAAEGTQNHGGSQPSAAPDQSGPVALESQDWSCPWPREAELDAVDEQTVVLRVIVAAAGQTEAATIIVDPGHGFGPAAVSCAMRTRFTPARDRDGRPVRATSPPIRVKFTR